ncbi:RNA-directed DNA polymerase [Bradyrhizobium sp. SZCCHNRI20481]|uniref:RNA-directed DNA polymerase n=1 Tax=Bradyrhizobium sp. SZCCHNRI20481 TaxID=3057286 RepID=UPI002915DD73|nr:RNA-directed DNA polymerase [Bradyrhizobium sp. SZCCHNRI20481]
MAQVSDEKIFQSFLQRGYLPEVLPPIFTSKKWATGLAGKEIAIDLPKEVELQKISYSCTKRGYGRRYFDFVHPASAVSTSAWMSRHWKDIESFCSSTQTAPTQTALEESKDNRCIVSCSFDRVLKEAKERLAGARYIVRADVAKYYSSIYTHAISWALNGKDAAKQDRGTYSKKVFGNEFDWAIRIGQGNQTKGIPVGPDFSRAAGEVVGTAIDKLVLEKIDSRHIGYVRNIDDFYIGAHDLASAEAILHALQESLRAYELELNDDKTSIKEASTLIDDSWIHELDLLLNSTPSETSKGINRAFDRAFYYASNVGSDSALKYLVRTVDTLTSSDDLEFDEVEHSLVRSLVSYPHCVDYCILLFLKQHALGNANTKLWRDVICRELTRHLSSSHDHEASWLLTAIVGAEIKVGKLSLTPDPNRQITNTLLLHCLDSGLVEFDGNSFIDEVAPNSEVNSNWLLCNEVISNAWVTKAARDRIARHRKIVVGKDISFLNPNFLLDLDSEEGRRAIPDRYNRYDDRTGEEEIEI